VSEIVFRDDLYAGECQLMRVCCTGVYDFDVNASCCSWYRVRLPVCVSIMLN